MRRIGMKGGKRRKSDTSSDADSGENGGPAAAATHNSEETDEKSVEEPAENVAKSTTNKKKSRGRAKRDDDAVAAGSDSTLVEEGEAEAEAEADADADADAEADASANDVTPGEQENGNATKSGSKKRKKEKQKPSTSQEKNDEDGEYEVEKVVAHRTIKGRRQFLVRWKGYGEDSDTWEQEKDLNCPQLIEDFLAADEEKEEDELAEETLPTKRSKIEKKTKKGTPRKGRLAKGEKQDSVEKKEDDNDEGEPKEFEVEKIMEVHHKKNKAREFLIRWKGFTSADDTWEPEENLNCPELISKFMEKVEKAKTAELRELRTNPAHTKRYTLTTHETGRRWSRRNMGKQRTTYYQCDE